MLTHASGKTMLTCKCIQVLVKIYHVVQELCAFSLSADGLAQWDRAMYTHCLPCQKTMRSLNWMWFRISLSLVLILHVYTIATDRLSD